MTRAWRLEGAGADTLSLRSHTPGAPGPGEVRVRMQAAAINNRDLAIAAGAYPNPPGIIPFSDGAGIVEQIGPGVEDFASGDNVISCFYPAWESGPATARNHRQSLGCEMDGVLAEAVVLPASALVHAPKSLTPEAAATLPCAGLTAWTALFTEGGLRAGQTILIMGTGGVAVFALQLARLVGARSIVLSGSEAKAERARSMGAEVVIDYRRHPDWAQMVLDATGGEGTDLIIELGGQDTLPQSLQCVKVGGKICVIGVLSGLVAAVPVPPILFRHIHITGITVGHREDLRALCRAVDVNALEPVIDARFAFEDTVSAYQALPLGRHFGKLVVTMGA